MASGDPVVKILQVMPPGSNAATLDFRPGGSTPAENVLVYDFDASTIEYMDFLCQLDGYGSSGLTFKGPWSASSATANETRWGLAIRRIQDDAEDIDSSHTYDFNEVDDTAPSASGEISVYTITFSNGADMDNLADGEFFILRLRRNASHANDDMSGDAEHWGPPVGKET